MRYIILFILFTMCCQNVIGQKTINTELAWDPPTSFTISNQEVKTLFLAPLRVFSSNTFRKSGPGIQTPRTGGKVFFTNEDFWPRVGEVLPGRSIPKTGHPTTEQNIAMKSKIEPRMSVVVEAYSLQKALEKWGEQTEKERKEIRKSIEGLKDQTDTSFKLLDEKISDPAIFERLRKDIKILVDELVEDEIKRREKIIKDAAKKEFLEDLLKNKEGLEDLWKALKKVK